MAVYNVDKIDNWYNDFVSLKNKFNNTYYSDYKSSYIRSCSDSAVKKMQSSLDEHYSKIQKMYNSINTAWNSYLKDLKNTDRRLAGGKGGINASSVSSKLAKLPVLQEYKRSLNIRIKSVSGVVGTAKGIGWSENRTIDQNLEYLKNRVGATITTAGVSLVEGLGIFAEGLVDVAAITTTGIATVIAYATSDADEAREISDQIWEDCRAFTSKQYVKSAFNSFYENTDVGKSLKKDSYAFDVVRSVGNEVGEVLGAVGISVATGGVINPAILYGTSKAGTHVEENWQDENTSTAAGLVKGTLQGIGDGIFFALGMKGDAVMKSAAINAVKKGGQQALKKTAILTGKTLFECGCSVAQDGSNILINAIFSDDIVKSQDGKDVKLNSFGDKLNYYYNQAGGMEGLMTSMATASVLSFASDFVDVSKVGKNIDTNAAIKNADINANNMKNTIEGVNLKNIEVSTNPTKSDINLDVLRKEYDDLINWKNSDEGLYSKRLNEVYGDRFGSNSRYKRNMARIAELETKLFNKNDQILKSKDISNTTIKKTEDKILLKRKDTTLAQNLNSYHFNKLSIFEQEKYIKSCNVNQLNNLIQDEGIIRKYSKIIDEKIIKNQDLIFIKGLSPFETSAFNKYIFDNEYILKNISNDNLVLLIGSSFDGDPIDNALKEAEKRIKSGDVLFEGNVIRKGLFNNENNYAFNAVNKMSDEIQDIIIKNGREISSILPAEIRNIDYGNTGLLQKMSLGKMYANGELDATSINFIKSINDNGIGGLSKANTKLFNKEIINSLGEDYIIEVMNYPELSKKVVSLFNNDRRLFDSFSEVMKKNLTDNSLDTFYIKNKSYLNFLFDNQEVLRNVDSSVLKSDAFMNYVLYNSNSYNISKSISKKIPVDFSMDYERKLAKYCDNQFNKSIEANNIRNAKEAYFQKYFSISYDEARTFVSKYSDHIDEVIKYDNNQTANTIINLFKKIDETEDLSYLKKLYDTQEFNFNAEEMISLDSTIKEVYSKSYVDKLTQTNDYIKSKLNQNHEIIDFNGKKVDIIDIDDNFNFIVHSSDTGYVVDKELINNSYIDTWKSISPETHGLSTSYISDTNIGSAPVGGKGVLYAFNDINTKNIGVMAPYDVNGHVADYGFSSGNKQIYISADEMSNNTLRVYNELVLDRKSVKPSYIIVYTDMSKESVDSAIKAASEWEVPVIRIDKTNLAKKQLSQINDLIDRFNRSGDLNLLDKALNKYEANVAGYKLNSNVADGVVDATSSINNDIVADLFNSSHIENIIMDYASKTDNAKNINGVIDIIQGIKDKYDIVNLNGTKIVANTKSSFDIDTIIEILREKIGV